MKLPNYEQLILVTPSVPEKLSILYKTKLESIDLWVVLDFAKRLAYHMRHMGSNIVPNVKYFYIQIISSVLAVTLAYDTHSIKKDGTGN